MGLHDAAREEAGLRWSVEVGNYGLACGLTRVDGKPTMRSIDASENRRHMRDRLEPYQKGCTTRLLNREVQLAAQIDRNGG
jgi:hypothetical protein